jgi:hypothetical protein
MRRDREFIFSRSGFPAPGERVFRDRRSRSKTGANTHAASPIPRILLALRLLFG